MLDMPSIFVTIDKIKPAYDAVYKFVMLICKLLLIADILITTMAVCGRYIPFIPDPAWSEEVVLTCMSYMAGFKYPPRGPHPYDGSGPVSSQGTDQVPGYSGGHCSPGTGCDYDYRRLELCHRPGVQGYVCEYAEGIPVLDVLSGALGRRSHACI